MSLHRSVADEHTEISGLLPWYLNGTVAEEERLRMEGHLRSCALCREDLERERRVYEAMHADLGVEYMPGASLKKLTARLDDLGSSAETAPRPQRADRQARVAWRGLAAASVVLTAAVLGLGAAWLKSHEANYHTVTVTAARPPEEVIRAVFAPSITLEELQSVLDEAQLRIVAGPTEAGVYSLASTSSRPVSASLGILRAHASVRFAESTRFAESPR
jgi:anti-sigma factor RsiW